MTALKHLPRLALAAILATAADATLVATTAPQPALAYPSGYHQYYRWQRSGGSWIRIGFFWAPSPGFYPRVGYVGYAPPPVYAVPPPYAVPTYAAPPPYYAPAYYAPAYYAPAYYRPAYYGPSISLSFFFGGHGQYYGHPYYYHGYHGYHGWRR